MRKIPAAYILLLALTIPSAVPAETLVPSEAYHNASRCILESRYADAEKIFDDFIRENPGEPLGYLMKAAVIQYAGTDYEDESREEEFYRLLERAEIRAERKLKDDRKDLWAHYCVYSARCFRGVRLVSGGSFIKGVLKSRSGANGMAKIRSTDPRFYDAWLCDGSYRFWKSAAAKSAHVFPFVADERNGGIEDVKQAIARGVFTGPVANTVLLEMLLEENPDAAAELGGRLVRLYPRCRLFAWQLGEAYKKLGRYEAAVAVFSNLAEEYIRDPADDGSGPVRCWWKLAVLARSAGNPASSRRYCEMVLDLGRRESVAKRQRARIEGAKHMIAELRREQE
ncbi:MAG: tetratricopeptide repeat protein [Candidatus Latescibacterota bacterium]